MADPLGPRFRWRCILGVHTWQMGLGPAVSPWAQLCRYCREPRRR